MRLQVVTPFEIAVDTTDVVSVQAEDATGSFGILPHHADFLTNLAVSVLTWHDAQGEHRIAVRGGVLRVRDGDVVQVATRQAVGGETLDTLGVAVLDTLREEEATEAKTRISATRLHIGLIRQLERYIHTREGTLSPGSDLLPRLRSDSGQPPEEG